MSSSLAVSPRVTHGPSWLDTYTRCAGRCKKRLRSLPRCSQGPHNYGSCELGMAGTSDTRDCEEPWKPSVAALHRHTAAECGAAASAARPGLLWVTALTSLPQCAPCHRATHSQCGLGTLSPVCFVFCDRVSLCSPSWPGNRDPPALACQGARMTDNHAWLPRFLKTIQNQQLTSPITHNHQGRFWDVRLGTRDRTLAGSCVVSRGTVGTYQMQAVLDCTESHSEVQDRGTMTVRRELNSRGLMARHINQAEG